MLEVMVHVIPTCSLTAQNAQSERVSSPRSSFDPGNKLVDSYFIDESMEVKSRDVPPTLGISVQEKSYRLESTKSLTGRRDLLNVQPFLQGEVLAGLISSAHIEIP